MTRDNWRVLAIFLGGMACVIAGYVAWDLTLASESRISWGMSLLRDYPILVYVIGVISGGLFIGLPIHFWWSQISPADYAELSKLRLDNSEGKS